MLAVALALMAIVVSGPVARAIGDTLGVGEGAVTAFNIVKWPVILAVVIVIVALLYYATPNVRQPKFHWISVGAAIGIGVWLLASAAFGFYVSNFGSYNKTYGSLAGVIIFLLWLWLTNLALLFGAEVDSELERARELEAGIEAEETLQLPPRDTKKSDKAAAKREEVIAEGRAIREAAEEAQAAEADAGRRRARRRGRRPTQQRRVGPGRGWRRRAERGQQDPASQEVAAAAARVCRPLEVSGRHTFRSAAA